MGLLIREPGLRNVAGMNAPRLLQQGVENSTVAIDQRLDGCINAKSLTPNELRNRTGFITRQAIEPKQRHLQAPRIAIVDDHQQINGTRIPSYGLKELGIITSVHDFGYEND